MGFTYGTFDLKLVTLDVADCVRDTRLSPQPSVVALGCLDEGDKRGDGQGRYSSWLSLRPGTDPTTRIG